MIRKRIIANYWDDARPAASIWNIASNGKVDIKCLEKTAAHESFKYEDIKPKKGYAYVHLITTGAGEYFSANSNNDFYNEKGGIFKTASGNDISLKGGLEQYHKTYKEYGGVYKNHANSRKGFKSDGSIVAETYNPVMHRGELIIEMPLDKWASEIEKIERGEPVYFSQGSSVPYDICSYCANTAKTRAGYCEHLKFHKHAIDDKGNQVFAINDQPYFHDISVVDKPADRIAFALAKVASVNNYSEPFSKFAGMEESSETVLYLPTHYLQNILNKKELKKVDLIQKLAKIEKEVILKGDKIINDLSEGFKHPEEDEDKIVKSLETEDTDKVVKGMHDKKMLMGPRVFIKVVLKRNPDEQGLEGLGDTLKNIFSTLEQTGEYEDVAEDQEYCPMCMSCGGNVSNKLNRLSADLSTDPDAVEHRIIKNTIKGKKDKDSKQEKSASAGEPSIAARYLAKEYAKYQLAFLVETNTDMMYALAANRAV